MTSFHNARPNVKATLIWSHSQLLLKPHNSGFLLNLICFILQTYHYNVKSCKYIEILDDFIDFLATSVPVT